MDRLEVMELYCCIVELGQLSLAADHFNVSKGTVSKQLAALESQLGGRLLHRTTRSLSPTEAGQAYYTRAKQILESVEEANHAVMGWATEPKGTLKINAPMSFGSHHLGELLAQYQKKYPKVNLQVELTDRQIDVVEEGFDLVLRISILEDSSLVARRLAACNLVLCAAPEYLALHGEPDTPEALKSHNCLTYAYADSQKYWSLVHENGAKAKVMVSGGLQANNGILIADALRNGLGIALLPTFIVGDSIRSGEVQLVLAKWRPVSPDIALLYPSSKYLSAKVRAFVDMAVDYFEHRFS